MIFGRKKATTTEDEAVTNSQKETTDKKAKDADKKAKSSPALKRDRTKAMTFFRHASAVADARNTDYSIQLYLDGLSHDPDNMNQHEALREVALRRKVAGGKPAKFMDRWKGRGKGKIEKMLQAEYLWAKNPLNLNAALTLMERAMDAEDEHDEYNFGEVAHWVGTLVLEKNETDRPLVKDDLLKLLDLFSRIGSFTQAVTCCRWAMELDPSNPELPNLLKNLQAEEMMTEGGYNSDQPIDEIKFEKNVRDMDQQQALEQESQLSKTERAVEEILERAREAFEKNPDDKVVRQKLVKALLDKRDESSENEAITLLEEGYAKDEDYKYQVAIGDIRIRQLDRDLKAVRKALSEDKSNADLQEKQKAIYLKKIKFEIKQFTDRAKHYPTDRKWKFELGRRLFVLKKYDKAVEMFQQSVGDAKCKVLSLTFLGQCYLHKDWPDEAVQTLERAIEAHKDPEDRLGLEIKYHLMTALEKIAMAEKDLAIAKKAQKIASEILQTDINFKDIRTRMDQIRALVKKLAAGD